MTELITKSMTELAEMFHAGDLSSREITDAFIAEIESRDDELNSFVTTTFDLAREQADAADSRRDAGKLLSPIDGMPITLKDVVCTTEVCTTASSDMLKNFVPPYDATVWGKLKAAGAVLLGKTNTDEFTMGASTETSAFGVTKNPYETTRVAGGSSGGSAAAVGANFCAGSVGTDTGGSIRQPASFCGCTGLKVSYGRVSRWGVMPMASSLDTIGPLAKTAADCALLLDVMAGRDEKDSTTPEQTDVKFSHELDRPVDGLRVGIPAEYLPEELDEEVRGVFDSARETLTEMSKVDEVSLPHTEYAVPVYYILAPCEISANMARYDGLRFGEGVTDTNLQKMYTGSRDAGFGDEVKRRILLGTFALSAGHSDQYYRQAQRVRTLVKQDFGEVFKKCDVLLTPVSPTPAFKIGQKTEDPVQMYLEDVFTIPSSLAGCCAISIPVGTSKDGLPIGVQLIAPQMQEGRLLRIAHQLQLAMN